MFGTDIIDVLIGLITVFLLMSLTAAAIREAVEGVFKTRAVFLERGMRELLSDPSGLDMVKRFYEHPLVASLYQGKFVSLGDKRRRGRELPTYIPAKNFSGALLDIALRGQRAGPYAAAHSDPILTTDQLRRTVERLPEGGLRHAIVAAIDEAGGDLALVRTNLETWFDASMDRVSGWYKRRTQLHLFVIGVLLATILNVNTVTIANHLWRNKAAREALARRAEILRTDSTFVRAMRDSQSAEGRRAADELASLDLPLGWDHLEPVPPGQSRRIFYGLRIVFGLLITGLAVTLGAPFWFDALNRIMVIRSTVKPHEKSPEESSEDRQSGGAGGLVVNLPTGNPPGAAAPPVAPPAAPSLPSPDFTPREWAFGSPDMGVL